MTAVTPTCPACKEPSEQRAHCPSPVCGWSRCTRISCRAVWRNHDRHIMAPASQPSR